MKIAPLALFVALCAQALFAQQLAPADGRTGTSRDPSPGPDAAPAPAAKPFPGHTSLPDLLGLTLAEVFSTYGPPEEVFPLRGDSAWQDDVVFYYPDHSYLFWFRDRVWQVRVDERFGDPVLGVAIGESMEEVEQVLGSPFHADGASLIFLLPDRGYPVRARLFFESDRLTDVYVYRGDF